MVNSTSPDEVGAGDGVGVGLGAVGVGEKLAVPDASGTGMVPQPARASTETSAATGMSLMAGTLAGQAAGAARMPDSLFPVSARKRFPWARLWVGVATVVGVALAGWFAVKVLL
jgi:hypothetical protein